VVVHPRKCTFFPALRLYGFEVLSKVGRKEQSITLARAWPRDQPYVCGGHRYGAASKLSKYGAPIRGGWVPPI
jgi:hypothetical protein